MKIKIDIPKDVWDLVNHFCEKYENPSLSSGNPHEFIAHAILEKVQRESKKLTKKEELELFRYVEQCGQVLDFGEYYTEECV